MEAHLIDRCRQFHLLLRACPESGNRHYLVILDESVHVMANDVDISCFLLNKTGQIGQIGHILKAGLWWVGLFSRSLSVFGNRGLLVEVGSWGGYRPSPNP